MGRLKLKLKMEAEERRRRLKNRWASRMTESQESVGQRESPPQFRSSATVEQEQDQEQEQEQSNSTEGKEDGR